MLIVPIRVMAEIAAAPIPTSEGVNRRAASHQYKNPSPDVTAVVPISEPELKIIARYEDNQRSDNCIMKSPLFLGHRQARHDA